MVWIRAFTQKGVVTLRSKVITSSLEVLAMSTNAEWFYRSGHLVARNPDGRLSKPLEVAEEIGRPLAGFLNSAPNLGRLLLPPWEQ